jgi:hypothetical protein
MAPSLTRVDDYRNTYYGMGHGQWAVSAASVDDLGTFVIGLSVVDAGHWYHGTNIQAGWIGIASRTRNVYNP